MTRSFCFKRPLWGLGWISLSLSAMSGSAYAQVVDAPTTPIVPNYVFPEIGVSSLPGTGSGIQAPGSGSGGSTGGGSSTGITPSGPNSLAGMDGQSWGYQAAQNAQTVGVNPAALAAMCQIESQCQNLNTATGPNHTITGAFQMTNGTYTQEMNEALAQNPELAGSVTSGLAGQNDPASQAVAAAQYMKDGANYLQNQGVVNPTALDVRGYYNFGPQAGANLAQASDSQPVLGILSASTMASNGISPGETVGQWRAASAAKMGTGATALVLT